MMSRSLKRRIVYIAVPTALLLTGWVLMSLMSGQSVHPGDLDTYARTILRNDRSLNKRDIAMLYALGSKESSVSLETPKWFVFRSFLNQETVEVREDTSAANGGDERAVPTLLSVSSDGGRNARLTPGLTHGSGLTNRSPHQSDLNRAAIIAYLSLSKRSEFGEQCTIHIGENAHTYWADVRRVPFSPGGCVSLKISKDFKRAELLPGE